MRTVLLVDDDAAMAEMYRLGLERRGFRVVVAPNAANLAEVVDLERPDILVLDWELPGLRGDIALERLRTTQRGRELPVFMLSNFPGTNNGAIDRAFYYGAIAWLEKANTTPAELAVRLGEALGADLIEPAPADKQ